MIGKYRPTYTLQDLWRAAIGAARGRARLQDRLQAIYGVRHAILFRSAREGLQAVFRALHSSGSAVVPAYNCIAVPEAVEAAGWRPVLADVAPGDVNMDCSALAACADGSTSAVVLTHQFGIPPDVEEQIDLCRRRNWFVVEDAAAAIGARFQGRWVGTFGDVAALSFHLTKIVSAGRAGAILTNDDVLAKRIQSLWRGRLACGVGLRDFLGAVAWWCATRPVNYAVIRRLWGVLRQEPLYQVVRPRKPARQPGFRSCSGFAARLAELQLRRLDANVATRKHLAQVYSEALTGTKGVETCPIAPGADPCWMQFPVFVEQKDACYRFMLRRGVDLSWTFRYSCGVSYGSAGIEQAERAARRLLGLPTYPALPLHDAQRIATLLREFAERAA